MVAFIPLAELKAGLSLAFDNLPCMDIWRGIFAASGPHTLSLAGGQQSPWAPGIDLQGPLACCNHRGLQVPLLSSILSRVCLPLSCCLAGGRGGCLSFPSPLLGGNALPPFLAFKLSSSVYDLSRCFMIEPSSLWVKCAECSVCSHPLLSGVVSSPLQGNQGRPSMGRKCLECVESHTLEGAAPGSCLSFPGTSAAVQSTCSAVGSSETCLESSSRFLCFRVWWLSQISVTVGVPGLRWRY